MKKLILYTVVFSAFFGCAIEQRMHKNPALKNRVCSACGGRDTLKITKHDSIYIERTDTVFVSLPDTATTTIRLKCDSLGNVYIAEIRGKNGKIVTLATELKNNLLTINAYKQKELFHLEKIKELEKRLNQKEVKQITYIDRPVPYLPWWVKWILYPLSTIGAIASLYAFIKWGIPLILKAIRKGTIGI